MISLVYIVKQKQTRKRERVIGWGTQLTQKFEVVKRKEPLYKETNTVTGQVLASEYS